MLKHTAVKKLWLMLYVRLHNSLLLKVYDKCYITSLIYIVKNRITWCETRVHLYLIFTYENIKCSLRNSFGNGLYGPIKMKESH